MRALRYGLRPTQRPGIMGSTLKFCLMEQIYPCFHQTLQRVLLGEYELICSFNRCLMYSAAVNCESKRALCIFVLLFRKKETLLSERRTGDAISGDVMVEV